MGSLTTAAKGCVVQATSGSAGYYRVHGLQTSGGVVFVQSVSTNRSDIAAAVACFGNRHRFYVFGRGFGNVVVDIEAFLGNQAADNTEAVVNSFFETNRSASLLAPITVTSRGGGSYSFYLVGCRVVGTNPDTNMIRFQLVGSLVD